MRLGRGRQAQIDQPLNKAAFQQLTYDFEVFLGIGTRGFYRRLGLAVNHAEIAVSAHDIQACFIQLAVDVGTIRLLLPW